MRDEHIIEILDNAPLSSLSAEQLQSVQIHSQACVGCASAYRAALVSSAVLKGRSQRVVEPSPFFQTKVLAALRERQAVEGVPAIVRLWKSAGALVSSLAAATVALAALSFVVPTPVTPLSDQAVTAYSAESVILDQEGDEPMSYDQVLSAIYADVEEGK